MMLIIQPDREKAKALVEMARVTLERLSELSPEKYPSNTLTDYYDSIHKLMDALSLTAGIKFTGEGAHKELIEYIAKKFSLEERLRGFLQQMREYRNRIAYEGFVVKENFIQLNRDLIGAIIDRLIQLNSCELDR
jgi:uncharacterized protein (UPF0332 family)